jgi:hypothetical protein
LLALICFNLWKGIIMRKFVVALLLLLGSIAQAQGELAATLEVLAGGVSVRRVNTAEFITVTKEAIVGVGDVIKTDATGRARITFFADGTETDLQPGTEYSIVAFTGDATSFQLTAEVLVGQTVQRLGRVLDANSVYNVRTSGMTLAARGTTFLIRVEESGRSAMLVTEGTVEAAQAEDTASVPPEFGVRADADTGLSDVVRATSFAQLDSALDGCAVVVRTVDDVSLNVRQGPSVDAPRVGFVGAEDVTRAFGTLADGKWYRIAFKGGFGWVLSSTATVDRECAGLRIFTPDTREDASLYSGLDADINAEALSQATDTSAPEEPAAEATPGS